MYSIKVSNNNNVSIYDGFKTLRDATMERSKLISAYGCSKKKGFIRENCTDYIRFTHAVYSSVIFEIIKTN